MFHCRPVLPVSVLPVAVSMAVGLWGGAAAWGQDVAMDANAPSLAEPASPNQAPEQDAEHDTQPATGQALDHTTMAGGGEDSLARLTGRWQFASEEGYNGACRMTGHIRFTPIEDEPGQYVCALTAHEDCSPYNAHVAKQSCAARVTGQRVTIVSTLLEVTPPSPSYRPDNFVLLQHSDDIMNGTLWFGSTRADIVFERRTLDVS